MLCGQLTFLKSIRFETPVSLAALPDSGGLFRGRPRPVGGGRYRHARCCGRVLSARRQLLFALPSSHLSVLSNTYETTIPTSATGLLVFNRNAGFGGGVGVYYNAGPPAATNGAKLSTGAAPTGAD